MLALRCFSACILAAAILPSIAEQSCCPSYSQIACDHNDGYFFPGTCCGDGLWYCQARGMLGSVCKFSSSTGSFGEPCQRWVGRSCEDVDNPQCLRFVIGKAANGTLGRRNYDGTMMVDKSGKLVMGSQAVVFYWHKDNLLRSLFDGRCLATVSSGRIELAACNKASRWETQVSAADNGRNLPVVIVRQHNSQDKPTGHCLAMVGAYLRTRKCADAPEQQFILAPQTTFGSQS